MTDIVERLGVWPAAYGEDALSSTYVGEMAKNAANEIERLRSVLLEAELQIDYLHKKFKPTGTGEATLARIRAALPPAQTLREGS